MKKLLVLFIIPFLFHCDIEDDPYVQRNSINQFIWEGLNQYYLWQNESPNLADNKQSNYLEYTKFLTSIEKPEDFFNACKISKDIDRFSVIYSNFTQLEQVLTGNTGTDGVEYGLVSIKDAADKQIFGYVRFILPNTDAFSKSIKRGDIIWGINGQKLTLDNYRNLLSNVSLTYNLGTYSNVAGNITVVDNGQTIATTKTSYSENPIFYTNVYTKGSKKIGYLVYNGFYSNWETQLNNVFADFKSQNITHLILDLRYNPGGSVDTSIRLASMITGQFNGQVFSKQKWNPKVLAENGGENDPQFIDLFTNKLANGSTVNSLNLTKLVVITSASSASASELLINGLDPYIDVKQIGDKTTGKNVGSITLYDSNNFSKKNINAAHKYAMQPIVLKIANKNNFAEYTNGLEPDLSLKEDLANLGTIGNENEPLLSAALNYVDTNFKTSKQNNYNLRNLEFVSDRKFLIQNNEPILNVKTPNFVNRKTN